MKKNVPPPEQSGIGSDPKELYRAMTFGGTIFGSDVTNLPAGERRLLNALRHFYRYRHNWYVLAEALDICTRNHVNPPVWVLLAISEGFQRFIDSDSDPRKLAAILHMGKRCREEYNQYREQQPLMEKIHKRIDKDGIKAACDAVSNRHFEDTNNYMSPDALEKQYNRFWRDFYDFVSKPEPVEEKS